MQWNENSPAPAPAPHETAPQQSAPAAQKPSAAPMTPEEMDKIRQQIDSYSASPGIQSEVAKLVTANQQNPEQLTRLIRELSDAIESVKANPHAHHPVDPSIAQAVEQIREVELKKPDPLNLLRGGTEQTNTNLFTATPDGANKDRMPYKDMGDSLALIAALGETGFVPSNVPDVRAAKGTERGGRA